MPKRTSVTPDIEWEGTGENPEDWIRDDGSYAIETKDEAMLGQYLREVQPPHPDIIMKVANLLDPPTKNSPRLRFVGSRGRPVDERKTQTDGQIQMMVRFAKRKNGNRLKAALFDVQEQTGKSRSAIFAAMAGPKKPAKKPRPTKK